LSVLNKVRRWIDGESAELVLEEAARNAQVKPRSQAEAFIVKIARAVEKVMQDEMVPLPQGTTIIPSEYTIFLSGDDDKEWQGVKRKGLEQGLYHILAERAKEIAGKKKLETKSFVIELRVDGTLEKDEVRVQHGWEDSSGSKTGVLARPKPVVSAEPKYQPPPPTQPNFAPASANQRQAPTSPNFTQPQQARQVELPQTMAAMPVPTPAEEGEVMTQVHKRVAELYRLEIWRNGVRQNVVPIYQNQVSIGRGSKSKPVDIALAGDAEISRRHLTLNTDGKGSFWIVNEGRNPAMINSYELPEGQQVQVSPGMSVAVCSYVLRIQPK
jgi:FHA domain./Protein of unknown function (DUF2662).